jgi:hypothetical protein
MSLAEIQRRLDESEARQRKFQTEKINQVAMHSQLARDKFRDNEEKNKRNQIESQITKIKKIMNQNEKDVICFFSISF